jgi:hypothetical protein
MNYLKKSLISALETDIYNSDSHAIGMILGGKLKLLADNNVEGCDTDAFLEGIKKGYQRATVKSITDERY